MFYYIPRKLHKMQVLKTHTYDESLVDKYNWSPFTNFTIPDKVYTIKKYDYFNDWLDLIKFMYNNNFVGVVFESPGDSIRNVYNPVTSYLIQDQFINIENAYFFKVPVLEFTQKLIDYADTLLQRLKFIRTEAELYYPSIIYCSIGKGLYNMKDFTDIAIPVHALSIERYIIPVTGFVLFEYYSIYNVGLFLHPNVNFDNQNLCYGGWHHPYPEMLRLMNFDSSFNERFMYLDYICEITTEFLLQRYLMKRIIQDRVHLIECNGGN